MDLEESNKKSFLKYCSLNSKYIMNISIILIIILSIFLIYFKAQNFYINKEKEESTKKRIFDVNFEYHKYQREKITDKIHRYSNWQLTSEDPYFINGIIRKYKPKKCLEIGVAYGGSSILILNAINTPFL